MATNDFKPFAVGSNANVTSQDDYEALAALASGFQAGKAASAQVNKALRQGTTMASVLGQFIADKSGEDVLDNGNVTLTVSNLIAAVKAAIADSSGYTGRIIAVRAITASSTYTPTIGTKKIIVEMVGAGGGGAACAATNATTASMSGGGSAGSYIKFMLSTVPSSVAVTVGTGGASGNSGGASVFGPYATVGGGVTGTNTTSTSTGIAGGGNGSYTITSSGVLVIRSTGGGHGTAGVGVSVSGGIGGYGGNSPFGFGGKGGANGQGGTAIGYGSGGGGNFIVAGGSNATVTSGGSGAGGLIIITELI